MPRARTEAEKFRSFVSGKTLAELLQLKERLEDIIAVQSPVAAPKRARRAKQADAPLLEQKQ